VKPDLDVYSERHDENGDHDVGDRQRHDEEVGGRLETSLAVDAEDDQDVAEHRQDGEDEQNQRPEVVRPGDLSRRHRRRRQRVETTSVSGPAAVQHRPEVDRRGTVADIAGLLGG